MSKTSPNALKTGLLGRSRTSAISRMTDAQLAASDEFVSVPLGADARNNAPKRGASLTATPGQRLSVPLDQLREGADNPRVFYIEDARLDGLLQSLARDGQLQDALVYPPDREHPYFELKEGHRRKRCLEKLGRTHISALVVARPAKALEAYRQAREVNKQRDNLTVFDDAVRFASILRQTPELKQEDFAKQLGESPEYVSKVLKVSALPHAVMRELAEAHAAGHKVGLAMAYLIWRFYELSGEEATLKLIRRVVEERISIRQLERLVQEQKPGVAAEEKSQTRLRPTTRAELGGRLGRGEVKCFPDGRLELVLHTKRHDFNGVMFRKFVKVLKDAGFSVGS